VENTKAAGLIRCRRDKRSKRLISKKLLPLLLLLPLFPPVNYVKKL
jgi:hypothetical protein